MTKLRILFLAIAALWTTNLYGQRTEQTLNDSWRFMLSEEAAVPAADNPAWTRINIPHTWNTDAYTVKKYHRGHGWYTRGLTLGDPAGKRFFLRFEAVNHTAEVYVNGTRAALHEGGYTAFNVDITPYVRAGENRIAVRADNTLDDTPTLSGDFTMFGGIYRDVWLVTTPEVHFEMEDHGSSGIFVTTKAGEGKASWSVRAELCNDSKAERKIILTHRLISPQGTEIKKIEQAAKLAPGKRLTLAMPETALAGVQLWSPDEPNLYTVETTLGDGKAVFDRIVSPAGFRWWSIDPEKGFFLNGTPLKLHGVCRHQDRQPLGNALSDEMHRLDMKLIKEMGANFIRISHYPQDEAIIEQCDRLGLLVWEETPIVDYISTTQHFSDVCHSVLRDMIRSHYNHPSVVMWGYMNEILLHVLRRFSDEEQAAIIPVTLQLAQSLERTLHEEDPTRLSAIAFHGSQKYYEVGLGDVTDIVGWNLYNGWYGGKYTSFEGQLLREHELRPTRPIIISEYGAGADRRLHSRAPRSFDFSIEYQQEFLEYYVPVIEKLPFVLGGSLWNMVDFGSAQRDESMPRINNKGLLYTDRTPKDIYYYFQAAWRSDLPVVHIASRDWNDRVRVGAGKEQIKVYSNLANVELLVDGVSAGTKKTGNFTAVFEVEMGAGKHILTARNGATEDCCIVTMTVLPEKLTAQNTAGLELAVNVGSNCDYRSPLSYLTWVADRAYTPGSWGYVGGEILSGASNGRIGTQTQIAATDDNPLFQTLRQGIEGYRFDAPDGDYEVELLFADLFGQGSTVAHMLDGEAEAEKNSNRFDVVINGRTVDAGVDIASESARFTASKRRYLVRATGNEGVFVKFNATSGTTFLNGIKIRKL